MMRVKSSPCAERTSGAAGTLLGVLFCFSPPRRRRGRHEQKGFPRECAGTRGGVLALGARRDGVLAEAVGVLGQADAVANPIFHLLRLGVRFGRRKRRFRGESLPSPGDVANWPSQSTGWQPRGHELCQVLRAVP